MQARRNQCKSEQAAAAAAAAVVAAAPSVVSVARDIHSREGFPGLYKGVALRNNWWCAGCVHRTEALQAV